MTRDRPDGALSGILYDLSRRHRAVGRHAAAEGYEDTPLESAFIGYDRALHPWMHGRRPHDIAERLRGWLP